jgi:hypothetical protein
MKPETITALKAEMQYTETPAPICKNCKHSSEEADPMLDRSWVRMCKFNTLGAFVVKDTARCSRFENATAQTPPGSDTKIL